jgi:TolA-binding protein
MTIPASRTRRLLTQSLLAASTLTTTSWLDVIPAGAQPPAPANAPANDGAMRGSIVEDRAAKKLIEAGDARYDADEITKAIEIWKSVIERYPKSRFRFDAQMRLGNYYLERDRSYDRARTHFEAVTIEDNRDDAQQAEATLKTGICYYHARNYGKCFQVMRDVVEKFPVSPQVNEAYYYIGLGHFQLAHYSRAIAALEKVGTTLSGDDSQERKLEAGKRFFVKIEDADLAVLESGEAVEVRCKVSSGDEETLQCFPVGRNVRLVLGSLPTKLGQPSPGNGTLEIRGGDSIEVTYLDRHTADKSQDKPVAQTIKVVGNGLLAITDGAFAESLRGVVLGKAVNLRVIDADHDTTNAADKLTVEVAIYRPKTDQELEAEAAALAGQAAGQATPPATPPAAGTTPTPVELDEEGKPKLDKFKRLDSIVVTLTESPQGDEAAIHTGVFQGSVPVVKADKVIAGDDTLQALPGDEIRVTYQDEVNTGEGTHIVLTAAKCLEGNIGGVRVTRAVITDQELRIQTQLKTSDALLNIGNRYKEFGLKDKAEEKYDQALQVCEEIMDDARRLGGNLLEQTYVQLWRIYFERDNLDLAAAMCQRLQNEFPNSGFVDDALLQLGEVARKQSNFNRAIGIFTRIVNMPKSQLRGEAQFGIAECYEQMATAAEGPTANQLQDRSFQEFKKVYDQFPDSGRVGEAVAKMANYYYQQKDFARAIDTFETVLTNHPDAKFLDVILFNYGRCLYRMDRKAEAKRRFDQLIADFPESPLAADAKKIAEALSKASAE